jgi:F-type H+-transporting ATPase subunit epsilon
MSADVHGGFGDSFSWSVSTPEGIAASGRCEFLVVPTPQGEMGVLAGHAALVGGVVPGDLRATTAGETERVSIGGGLVEVRDNQVRLLVTGASTDAADYASTPAADSATS